MFKYRFLLLIVLFVVYNSTITYSQQQVGLHFMNIWQTSKTNPAYISDSTIVVALPGFHLNYYNTTGDFNSLIVDYLNEGQGIKSGEALSDLPSTDNILRGILEVEIFNIGYRFGNVQLGLNYAQKTDMFLNFPKNLAQLFLQGNGQFVGEHINLSHDIHLTSYNEFGLSGAIQLNKLNVGARIKFLTGIANTSVEKDAISLFTDDDVYQLTLDGNYALNASGLANVDDLNNFNLSLGSYSFDNFFTENIGLAVDLGVTYEVNKRLRLSASILDLGKINWKKDVTKYINQGATTYEGFDFAQFVGNDSISFGNVLDTIENTFNFSEESESYLTEMPVKIYVSGTYQLNEKTQIGGLLYYENYRGEHFPVLGLSANAKFKKIFNVGATYSARKNSFFNFGLNLAINHKVFQFFASADNVVGAFQPYKSSNVNFRTGLNLIF
ncbi:DUF5723 family protein [Saprospiraceae bacterium]|nr:DUF5723 family protein [Saprospiraceae bacterium]MDC3210089.1 DUF5723 family protein [Saprospiraceae bacterium]